MELIELETIVAMLLLCQTYGSSRLMTILPNVGILKLLVTFHQRNVKYHNHIGMFILVSSERNMVWQFTVSYCLLFTNFIYISSDSYEAARSQEHIASIQSDINSEGEDDASQPNTSLGRGKRHKRPTKRFLPSSDDESVGFYGPTQPETIVIPTIPVSSSRNSVDGGVPAVLPTAPLAVQRRSNNSVADIGVSRPTQTGALVIPTVPGSLLRNSVGGIPAALTMSPLQAQQSCSNSFEEVSQHVREEIIEHSTHENQPVSSNNLYSRGQYLQIFVCHNGNL